jgi:hypothetical protein
MIRPFQITDIAGLLSFVGRSPANEARTRDRFANEEGDSPALLGLLKDCLIPAGREQVLVYTQSGQIQSLVCLRRLCGPSAWEVDRLFLLGRDEECCVDLLGRLGTAGWGVGMERLFLRVDSKNPLVGMAKQAGFSHYMTEALYRCDEAPGSGRADAGLAVRNRSSADEYGLFRLYSAALPVQVRCAEGMIFQEWRENRDRPAHRELVCEKDGEISSWLRFRFDDLAGQFEVTTRVQGEQLDQLVEFGLAFLKGKRPVYCVVPTFHMQLQRALEEHGFRLTAEFACLSRQLALRVPEPKMVPLQA